MPEKNTQTDNRDEADILHENETLKSENETLKGENATLKGEKETLTSEKASLEKEISTLTTARDDAVQGREKAQSDLAEKTTEFDKLNAEKTALEQKDHDFEASVARKVAELGVSADGADVPAAGGGANATLTEQCLAANKAK